MCSLFSKFSELPAPPPPFTLYSFVLAQFPLRSLNLGQSDPLRYFPSVSSSLTIWARKPNSNIRYLAPLAMCRFLSLLVKEGTTGGISELSCVPHWPVHSQVALGPFRMPPNDLAKSLIYLLGVAQIIFYVWVTSLSFAYSSLPSSMISISNSWLIFKIYRGFWYTIFHLLHPYILVS